MKFQNFKELLLVVFVYAGVEATLLERPKDTEAVIGSTARFFCRTNENYNINWDHVPLTGSRKRREVYLAGGIISPYHERFSVEIDRDSGHFHLIITNVQREDAGTFECIDKAGHGERVGAELVVLESPPNCEHLSNSVTIVGENDCGVEPDLVQFRCRLKYYGSIYPSLEWRVTGGSEVKPETVVIEVHHHQVTFTVTITPTKEANDHSYTCETRASGNSWTSERIHVLYAHNSHKKTTIDHAGWHRCTANGDLPCNYRWTKNTDDGEESLMTTNHTAYIQSSGHYVCYSVCDLRGQECVVISKSLQLQLKDGKSGKADEHPPTLLLLLLTLVFLAAS